MQQTASTFLHKLAAEGPNPAYAEKMALFGHFIGSWSFTWRDIGDETAGHGTGEWHFGWVLEGRAVQDVWIAHHHDGRLYEYGTTVRSYNPETDAWNVSWNGPYKRYLLTFIASRVGDEIVLEGPSSRGHLLHWIFSDIEENAFRWRGEISLDGGKTWTLYEEMYLTRVTP